MAEFENINVEEQLKLRRLADQVVECLALAAVPVRQRDEDAGEGGATIDLDFGADSAGGLYVHWTSSRRLRDKTHDALKRGEADAPVLHQSFAISEAMANAVKSILTSHGFAVEDADDDMRPCSIHVLGAPS